MRITDRVSNAGMTSGNADLARCGNVPTLLHHYEVLAWMSWANVTSQTLAEISVILMCFCEEINRAWRMSIQ